MGREITLERAGVRPTLSRKSVLEATLPELKPNTALPQKHVGWKDLQALGWLGKSQIRFGATPEQQAAFAFLDKKFLNKELKILTGGDILLHLIAKAAECDGKEGPARGSWGSQSYPSRYMHVLETELGIPPGDMMLDILRGFVKNDFFARPALEADEKVPHVLYKMHLTKHAKETAAAWQTARATQPATPAQGGKAGKYEYIRPPVDLSKLSPEEAINAVAFPEDVLAKIQEKLQSSGSSGGGDGSKAKSWLNVVFRLPWLNETKDRSDVKEAKKTFDANFYGMEGLKRRLTEEISVRNFKGGNKGGIILLVGPPGTGKTAVAKVLAEILGRKFVRRSLAGINDAHKVTGHNYTYVGAKQGMIIDAMIEANTMNPLFQIDEIDKVGKGGNQGDPHDALLAVLDPQQNDKFEDSYLDFPFDLSKVLFVCTANRIEEFPAPLLSRTEVIYFDSYLPEEKLEIAMRHLIPKQYGEYNIPKERLTFQRDAVEHLINHFTHEGGVRKLEQRVKDLFRKASHHLLEHPETKTLVVTPKLLDEWLPNANYKDQVDPTEQRYGVVNGLFYSELGGGILPVQVSTSEGAGGLMLTGRLGETMQEAAKVALSYLKANGKDMGIPDETLKSLRKGQTQVHIHYPDGAVPKDGPSAGSSTFLCLWSALSGQPVPAGVALTGEIDLKGKVKAIGGILEKVSGAIAQGVTTVYLPKENQKHFNDACVRSPIFKKMTDAIEVKFVDNAKELVAAVQEKNKQLLAKSQPTPVVTPPVGAPQPVAQKPSEPAKPAPPPTAQTPAVPTTPKPPEPPKS